MFDAIIVGGGHNGLTAAGYLSRSGIKTLVLERRSIVGGAAVTEEICAGYRASSASYVVSLLRQEVVEDLELRKYGYSTIPIEASFGPELDGSYMLTDGTDERDRGEFEKFSQHDYEAKVRFERRLERVADFLRGQMLRVPPKLHGNGLSDVPAIFGLFRDASKLKAEERYFMTKLFTASASDILDSWFESEAAKKYYASSVTVGTFTSLHTPGSALNLLHLKMGELDGVRGAWAVACGGMGAITGALAESARDHGAEIRTDAEVERIIVEGGRAMGVKLKSGEEIRSKLVLANTDPNRTFLKLVGAENLPADFAREIKAYKLGSSTLRMNLALSTLPSFTCLPGSSIGLHHKSFMRFIPGMVDMERNYRTAVDGLIPDAPIVDALIPSAFDDSLAPAGGHVLSLLCQHYPFQLAGGRSWNDAKDEVADGVIRYLEKFMPGLSSIVVGRKVISPLDLEVTYGLTRGDVYHGALRPDQIFSFRPHPDAAQYATPVDRLYLCGAGSHPGGGVSGAPGYNAAHRVIRDFRRF
jgi:phytoene dehydrogenase-like protein